MCESVWCNNAIASFHIGRSGVTNPRKGAQSGAKDQKWRKGPKSQHYHDIGTVRGISQLSVVPEQSMTYQFVSTFHDKFIYLVALLIGRITNLRKLKTN